MDVRRTAAAVPVSAFSSSGVKVSRHNSVALWALGISTGSMVTVSVATVAEHVLARKLHWCRLKLFVTVCALANASESRDRKEVIMSVS